MSINDRERRIQTTCLLLLTAVALGLAMYFLRPVLIPFLLAIFLVYCLAPVIDVQMRWFHLRRPVAVLTTALIGCILLILLWLIIWESVGQMTANAKMYETQLVGMLDWAGERLPLEALGVDSQELDSILQMPRESARAIVGGVVSSVMNLLSKGLLVIIFVLFIMTGKRSPPPEEGSLRAEIDARVRRYLVTKVLVSATTGLLVGLTLWLLGVDLALAFGVMAFLLNFIPSVGSVISTLLPLPVVVLNPELGLSVKVLAIAIPGAIQFAIGNLIEPKIMGESLDLHPVVVLLGLVFFGMLWGIIGMFIATPIVAVLKIILQRIEPTAPVSEWLAGRLEKPERAAEVDST